MQNLPDNVKSYLKKHSTKNYKLEFENKGGIDNVIVIPAIAEYENIQSLLSSLSKNDAAFFYSTLVLFVINNSHSSESSVKEDNRKSVDLLRSIINSNGNKEFKRSGLQSGLIDVATDGNELTDKESGVGIARKIGMDMALAAFDYEYDTKKLIICLDADCTVSSNYITNVINDFNKNNYSAAIVNFEHNIYGSEENTAAIICYEIFLRYYVAGLSYANSAYSFHTVGSTIVCDRNSYIKIGGMNKGKAPEGFNFLEKISKHFSIGKLNSTTVFPSSRSSWRVPFGTGQRVTRFLAKTQNEYLLFDPLVFEILKSWLEIYNSNNIFAPRLLLDQSKVVHPELYNFLVYQNFEEQWSRILSNTKSDKQLKHQKRIWFDGFKTLKLIHHLRDTAFPEITMFDALDRFFAKLKLSNSINRNCRTIPGLQIQKEYLR